MYSWEITQTMEKYEYRLPSNLYLDMTQNSPQIIGVTFDSYHNRFEIWDHEDLHWTFEVYLQQDAA